MVDELPPNDASDALLPPGPRRSTYTPPPSPAPTPAADFTRDVSTTDVSTTDDDALAGALSQEYQRWVPPTSPVTTLPPDDVVSAPTPEPPAAFAPSPFAASAPEFPPPPPPPAAGPPDLPPPPQRESLTDEQLLQAADLDAPEHDTGALLDLVERELALRQAEARRVAEWEEQVRAADVPEAEELVSSVRSQFTGVIPIIPAAEPAPPAMQPPVMAPPVMAPPVMPPVMAPPPASETPPGERAVAPSLPLALADAPPPYGIVPSAVAPPPSAAVWSADDLMPEEPAPSASALTVEPGVAEVPPLVEPSIPSPAPDISGTAMLFDELLREPPVADDGDPDDDTVDDPADAQPGDMARNAPAIAAVPAFPVAAAASAALIGGTPVGVMPVDSAPVEVPEGVTAPVGPSAGRVEVSALEPTPAEQRAGRSVRLFWLWFAVNASVVSLALGAVILGLGVSLRQAVLATLMGVAMSFLPLGLGTLAGKWSGQPTMVVSRATFGTVGNVVPALLALVTRVAWAAALLWMLGTGVAVVLVSSGLVEGLGQLELTIAAAALGLVLAALVSGVGFGMIAVVSAIVSVVSGVFVVGFIVLTVELVDLDVALSVPDGDWLLLVSGAVLVFSVVGLAWANSSGDVARYQAKGTYGSSAVLFAAFGATIPAFLLICWGAILSASNPALATGLQSSPIDTIARMLPAWYPVPLIAAVALSLLSAAALALYSSGFALLASGVRAPRAIGVLLSVVLTGAILAVLIVLVPDASSLFRDIVTTLAVPVAAWAGIFGAETMIRTRRVHSPSLLQSGGVYPAVRWVNLVMLFVITAVGWGLSSASVTGLQWQGYLFTLLGVDNTATLASSDAGVLVALLLGLLTPIVAGIPALRHLQDAEREAAAADAVSTSSVATRVDVPSA